MFILNESSVDEQANNFGVKLLSLGKEHDLQVVSGKFDNGLFTCCSFINERTGASLVDNLIAKYSYFNLLIDFYVYDLTENLDHCAISFVIDIDCIHVQSDISQSEKK